MKRAEVKSIVTGSLVTMWIENETLFVKGEKNESKCQYKGSLEDALEQFFGNEKNKLEIVIK